MNFNFTFKSFLLLFLSGLYSITINIPGDYSTIQEGIDLAVEGDTVLVADGDYQENIEINKSIILASHAIFDDLDDWVAYDDVFYEQWVINNSHIANTRIIGNNPGDDYGSAILITPDEDTCISPEITGFTIQYGLGTLIDRDGAQVRIGGGILADISDPLIKYNAFVNNGSPSLASGGAVQLTSSAEDWDFNDRENRNPRCEVEEFRISDNLYDDNDALYGQSVANRFHEDSFDMSGSIFDVFNCGADPENSISSVWVNVEDDASVDYSESEGNACAFTAPDVYVDSNIDQECLDEGCGFINNPFKTITRTLEMILATTDNPITIHLAPGTYSPGTGESFPLVMMDYVNIEGNTTESSILNALQQDNGIILIDHCVENTISKLTITGNQYDPNESSQWTISIKGSHYVKLIEVNVLDNSSALKAINSSTTIIKCNFENNDEVFGGLYDVWNANGGFKVFRSTFKNNEGVLLLNAESLFSKSLIYNHVGNIRLIGSSKLHNITIAGNESEGDGTPFEVSPYGNPEIENSILWSNNPSIISYQSLSTPAYDSLYVDYSNVEGGEESFEMEDLGTEWEQWNVAGVVWGENNVSSNPQFTNANYNLNLFTSPCSNAGNPDPWHNDTNSSRNDMGYTGGPDYYVDFTEYDFGELGVNSASIKSWTIINFGDEPLIIEEILNQNPNFSVVNTGFPIVIEPFTEKSIDLMFNPQSPGEHQAAFNFISNQISEDAILSLSGVGTSIIGNSLSGDLSGTILAEGSPYRIVNNITVNSNDILIIEPGVRFEFDGQHKFVVNGTLEAIGSESDSIVFTTLLPDMPDSLRWLGIDINNQMSATILDYVKIERVCGGEWISNNPNGGGTGFVGEDGGALRLFYSDPILSNMVIDSNTGNDNWGPYAHYGGGIYMEGSNPIISNSIIKNNIAQSGGGIYGLYSDMTLQNVVIENNLANHGGGIYLLGGSIDSSEGNLYILNNTASQYGGGINGILENLNNAYIIDNSAQVGGGIYDCYGCNIYNSVIYNNYASMSTASAIHSGGGITTHSTVLLSNVIVMGNESNNSWTPEIAKSSIYLYGGSANIAFINSIIWDNEDPMIFGSNGNGLLISTHSLIQDGTDNIFDYELNSESIADRIIWLDGNIDVNPQFNLGLQDFTLQENSPCIDAGTAYFEYEDEVILDLEDDEYSGLAPDMGAIEFISTDCDLSSLGDINGDETVNILDVIQAINIVLETSVPTMEEECLADINEDEIINILDIIMIVNIILNQ